MPTIGTLSLAVVAKTAGFSKGMHKAGFTVDGFVRKARSMRRIVMGVGGALAMLAGGAGMTMLLRSSMQNIDATAKLADRLDMSTEALTGFQYAAEISGVSQEQLATGLQYLARNIGDAVQGVGEGRRAFKALGLDVAQLAAMKPEEQFLAIADAMGRLPTAAKRSSAAMQIFGRGGAPMLNLLREGRTGIERLMKANVLLGTSFSRIDASKVEAANDAMTNLKMSITGAANRLAIQLAPTIARVANAGAFAFSHMGNIIELAVTQIHYGITKAINQIAFELVKIIPSADAAKKAGAGFAKEFSGAVWDSLRRPWPYGLVGLTVEILKGKREGQSLEDIANSIISPLALPFFNAFDRLYHDMPAGIAERVIDPVEAALDKRVGELAAKIGQAWVDFKAIVIDVPKVVDENAIDAMNNLASALKLPGAMEKGTRQAYSAIMATRPELKQMEAQLKETQEQTGVQKQILTAMQSFPILAYGHL